VRMTIVWGRCGVSSSADTVMRSRGLVYLIVRREWLEDSRRQRGGVPRRRFWAASWPGTQEAEWPDNPSLCHGIGDRRHDDHELVSGLEFSAAGRVERPPPGSVG
jgi:hypothetical protein